MSPKIKTIYLALNQPNTTRGNLKMGIHIQDFFESYFSSSFENLFSQMNHERNRITHELDNTRYDDSVYVATYKSQYIYFDK